MPFIIGIVVSVGLHLANPVNLFSSGWWAYVLFSAAVALTVLELSGNGKSDNNG